MILRRSLHARLALGAILWIAVALAVAGVGLTDLFRRHVEAQLLRDLEAHLNQLAATVEVAADGAVTLRHSLTDPRFDKPYSGLYWQVLGDSGPLLRSRSLWDTALKPPPDVLPRGAVHRHRLDGPDGQRLIVAERSILPPGRETFLRLVVGRDQRAVASVVDSFARTLTASLAVLAAGLIAAALAQVYLGLRPLKRVRAALADLRAEEGRQRLEGDFPAEIMPLVDDLNALMAHNAEVVERARTQAGNLAHGLKTPLTVIANETERLAARGEHEAAAVLEQQLAQARRQVDYHLAQARAAASGRAAGHRTPVADPVAGLCRVLGRLYEDREVTAEDSCRGLLFRGERQDFEEMLGNLMDNACKWARARVRVSCALEGTELVVRVDDDGPGLPPTARESVFARGRRLDESAPGAGLGLAIVRQLADLHGGSIVLADSPLGGLRAELRLPGAAGA